ncbi:hypothetical protein [Allosediminivita pacifica]|uniref:hypothetical protein n=1 Tax=Allosediminivita pacifica TaxID=1267769 RepID=UPI000D3751A7|nr:hypothetical protein [Allosediminivita pacifica]GGB04000.1 hypothetical protein GCM10011324_12730 [Allosediminivita pacifica]
MRVGLLALALWVALPGGVAAQQVYSGREAQALKCAWIFSKTASMLENADLISIEDLETSLMVSARILQLYVSGDDRTKLAGLRVVGTRRNAIETLAEFRGQSMACLRMFPVE